jgi:thymidylate synthase (methanogen type)
MKYIAAPTIGIVWVKAFKYIMDEGHVMTDGTKPMTEVMNMYLSVDDAQASDPILDEFADPEMIDWMVNKNFGGTEPIDDWGYSYGMRFRNFRGVDQIAEAVKKLKERPGSKSATITLMDPEHDFTGHMPCIITLDPKIRDNKLTLTGFFRSQDIGKKFYADMMALAAIQKEIADKVGVEYGSVELLITSAHVVATEYGKLDELRAALAKTTN